MPADELAANAQASARVVIVDDCAVFRQAAREQLERRGFRVLGEAEGSRPALGRSRA